MGSMVIGIFGDSFAEPINELSWTEILKTQYCINTKNYAQSCTSAYWSYRKLLSHIDEIDVIVFVVTAPGRLYHPDTQYHEVCNMTTVKHKLKDITLSEVTRKVFQAAEQYYIHLDCPEFNEFVHEQIVKSVIDVSAQHNKRLILIPAFTDSVKFQSVFETSLIEVTYKELETNFGDMAFKFEKLTRANHLSQENNAILAEKIFHLIECKDIQVKISDFMFIKYEVPSEFWVDN